MRKTIALIALLVLALSAPILAADTEKVTSDFKVTGMTCGGCEAGVKMKIRKIDGVEKVTASHKEGTASVTYATAKVSVDDIVAAIEDLGYTAELVETRTES